MRYLKWLNLILLIMFFIVDQLRGTLAVTVVEDICDTLTEKISDLWEQVQYVRKIAV